MEQAGTERICFENHRAFRDSGGLAGGGMAKIKTEAIVLDQGNTLIMDPFQPVLKLKLGKFTGLFRSHGIKIDAKRLVEEWAMANKEMNYPHIGHFFQEEPIIQVALASLGVGPDIASLLGLELLRAYRTGLKELIASDPRTRQVKETLGKLKDRGKRLGVFSNDRIVGLGLTLHCMGIQACFEYIETSESIGIEKPDPRVFDHILNWFCLPPHLITYVGDDPIRDIDAAKRKDLKAVWYSVDPNLYDENWRNYRAPMEFRPDAIITSFAELLDVLD